MSGSPRTHADDARARAVGQLGSTNEVADTARCRRGGGDGGKRAGQGNSRDQSRDRTQGRSSPSDGIERVRQAAKRDRKQRFTALLHHVYDVERLRGAYHALKRDAAAGIDGETWRHYGEALEENLRDLAARVKRGAFRASPVRRVYIPKADGRQRPLGVPTLEAKSSSVPSSRC